MRSCLSAYFSRRCEWTLSSMRMGCSTRHMASRVYILSLFLEICHTYNAKHFHHNRMTPTLKPQLTYPEIKIFTEQHFPDSLRLARSQPSRWAKYQTSAFPPPNFYSLKKKSVLCYIPQRFTEHDQMRGLHLHHVIFVWGVLLHSESGS